MGATVTLGHHVPSPQLLEGQGAGVHSLTDIGGPAPRKTASVMGREGGGGGRSLWSHIPSTGGRSAMGEGSVDLLAEMILYIVDPWAGGWLGQSSGGQMLRHGS